MDAYAAGRPLNAGLYALAQVIESIRSGSRRPVHTEPRDGTTTGDVKPRPRPYPHPEQRPDAGPPAAASERADGTVTATTARTRPTPYPRDQQPVLPPEDPRGDDEPSPWELVARAQAGEAEAFGQLYDRYVDLVFRYVYYRIGDRSTAEDFTSETFLRALRRIGSVTNQGRDIGAWFITIARNIVLDHVKSSRYRLEVATADMLDADRAEDGPEGAVLDMISNTELLKCVKRLNAEQQECIVLRFLEGLSVAETAHVMGKNEGAIKALQHRAIRRLGTLLPEGLR